MPRSMHARRVEAARLRARQRELQPEQVGRGQQDAVRVDRDRAEIRNPPGSSSSLGYMRAYSQHIENHRPRRRW